MFLKSLFLMQLTHFPFIVHSRKSGGDCCEYYCYDLDGIKSQFGHFSTYSAYTDIRESDFYKNYVPNCHPVKFWLLNRHGTRYPSEKAMNKSKGLYELKDEIIGNFDTDNQYDSESLNRGRLCSVDFELIRNWKWDPDVSMDNASHLAPRGYKESYQLAQQYKTLLPSLLRQMYKPEHYHFGYTIDDRVADSFDAFIEGLFGQNATLKYVFPEGRQNDAVLQAYESCELSKHATEKIYEKGSQLMKYQSSGVYRKMIREVSWRLGFEELLKPAKITLMWNMCRYDQSWHVDRPSAWCAAFTPAHIEILEYGMDIEFYYRKSYGNDINKELACATVANMLNHINDGHGPKAIIYFTHSTLIFLTLTLLGAFEDSKPLRHNNFYEMRDRKFQSSKMVPFGANLAVIKYECPNQVESDDPKILFLLNQKPLELDGCNNGVCDWSFLIEKFGKYQNIKCEDIFCVEKSKGNIMFLYKYFLVILILSIGIRSSLFTAV